MNSVSTANSNNVKAASADTKISVTPNGTPIVENPNDLDKDAFFKILAAELANQDPTQSQDTTAYITQLAQFTSMEQMSALNDTMTLNAAQSLTGKFVGLGVYDSNGMPESGVVRAVYKYKGEVFVSVEGLDGKLKDFKYSQVTDVLDYGDPNMDNLTFSNAATLIGKTVEVTVYKEPVEGEGEGEGEGDSKPTTETISGKVIKVYRDSEGIKIKMEVEKDGKVEVKDFLFDTITSVEP